MSTLSLPAHNTKLSSITIRYMINNVIITAVTIHNVIVVRAAGDDNIEIYQHGKIGPSTLILSDQIRRVISNATMYDTHMDVVVVLPVPCYQDRS